MSSIIGTDYEVFIYLNSLLQVQWCDWNVNIYEHMNITIYCVPQC